MNRFIEPPNEAVITLKSILEGTADVLYVVNDEEGWQFLSGDTVQPAQVQVVALERLLDRDESIGELGDLLEGCYAWRASPASPWQRSPIE